MIILVKHSYNGVAAQGLARLGRLGNSSIEHKIAQGCMPALTVSLLRLRHLWVLTTLFLNSDKALLPLSSSSNHTK